MSSDAGAPRGAPEADPDPVGLPEGAREALPLIIRWRVPEGSNVIAGQVIAHLSPPAGAVSVAGSAAADGAATIGANASSAASDSNDECVQAASSCSKGAAYGPSTEVAADASAAASSAQTDEAAKMEGSQMVTEAEEKRSSLKEWLLRAPASGILRLKVQSRDLVTDPGAQVATVEHVSCAHALVLGGMCVDCLQTLQDNHVEGGTVQAGFVSSHRDLRLHREVASRMEKERIISLLNRRKLCLVLDLDNTLLHATSLPPPVDCLKTILLDDFAIRAKPQLRTQTHEAEKPAAEEEAATAAAASQPRTSNAAAPETIRPTEAGHTPAEATKAAATAATITATEATARITVGETSIQPHGEAHAGSESSISSSLANDDGTSSGKCDSSSRSGSGSSSQEGNLKSGRSRHFSAPQQQTWEDVCFPSSPANSRSSNSNGNSRIYPHYRTDEEALRIVAELENSIICCRVAADTADPWGASFHRSVMKLRPGSIRFLRVEMHLFQRYVTVLRALSVHDGNINPRKDGGNFFGSRVFSRGDSVRGLKCIRRIFPTEGKLALAVDDSEFMWEDVAKCIKVQGYFFFQDREAQQTHKLEPNAFTHWLSASRPYCNSLPSVKTRRIGVDSRRRSLAAAEARGAAAQLQTHAEAYAQQQREQREERQRQLQLLQQQQKEKQPVSQQDAQSDVATPAAETAEAAATEAAEAATAETATSGGIPGGGQRKADSAPADTPQEQRNKRTLLPARSCTEGSQGSSDAFPMPRPLKRISGSNLEGKLPKTETDESSKASCSGKSSNDGNSSSNKNSSSAALETVVAATPAPATDARAAAAPTTEKGGGGGVRSLPEGPFSPSFFEPSELVDTDRQLDYLAQILRAIHFLYFRAVRRLIRAHRRPTAMRPSRHSSNNSDTSSGSSSSSATSSSGEEADDAVRSSSNSPGSNSKRKAGRPSDASAATTATARSVLGRCRKRDRLREKDSCPVALSVLENLPDVSWVLQAFRQQALQGVVISSTGLQGRHIPRLSCTDMGRLVSLLGGSISDDFDSNCTHLVCTKVTDKYVQAGKLGLPRLHINWLEKALYTWRRPVESVFDFRKSEGVYRSCWEPDEGHDPIQGEVFAFSDDIYGPAVRHVNKTIRGLQRSSYVHLCEALHGPLKDADLQCFESGDQTKEEEIGADTAEEAKEENAAQWEELWDEGFNALNEDEEES